MSQQVLVQLPKEVLEHLKKEIQLYQAEDNYKLAKSHERKVFRKILKEKNLTKEYRDIVEKLREVRRSNNLVEDDNARKKYYTLLTQKLKITTMVKTEKEFVEANNVAKERAREFREAYKTLRSDFELNIKPKIPL
ncbi:MAG: hypothetical protein QXO40_05790 [Candidatus Aenigmatarchaeota archaeon]